MAQEGVTVERAEDWKTLQRLLYRDSWNEDIDRHRSSNVFRGHSDREYTLTTSLQRFVGDSGQWDLELRLLRNFNKYAQQYIDEPESFYHLWSLAQHHGLPTQLLDWTYSPMVATFFATGGARDVDGEILVVDYAAAHELIPNVYRTVLEQADTEMFDVDLAESGTNQLLQESRESKSNDRIRAGSLDLFELFELYMEMTDNHSEPYVWFFEPPPIDQRIANQSGVLAGWFPTDPWQPMDEWLETHPEFFRRIIIPAERKQEFRDKLDRANINDRTLFPGLDGLAMWLTEYYKPTKTNNP